MKKIIMLFLALAIMFTGPILNANDIIFGDDGSYQGFINED